MIEVMHRSVDGYKVQYVSDLSPPLQPRSNAKRDEAVIRYGQYYILT